MHSAGGRGERTQTLEGVLLEAAFSFFLGRGKIKFHQHAESQLIFPNPKTVDIHHKRAKQNKTRHTNETSSLLRTSPFEKNLPKNRNIYIYIYTSEYIYINNALAKIPQTNVPSPKWSQLMKKDGSKIQVTQFQSKKFSALFLLLRRWGIHAARFRHGPHPCWLWRLCHLNETHASFEGISGIPLRDSRVSS